VANCLFCGIADGDIPANRVRESPRTISFRDINPQAPIHVLVIPKKHYADFAAVAEAGSGLLEEMASQAHGVAVAEGIGGLDTASCSTQAGRPGRWCRMPTRTSLAAGRWPGHPDDVAHVRRARMRTRQDGGMRGVVARPGRAG
jgi:hypothetical protein